VHRVDTGGLTGTEYNANQTLAFSPSMEGSALDEETNEKTYPQSPLMQPAKPVIIREPTAW
jgi:hypothetical protein